MSVAAASFAAGEFVVRAVMARLGVDDEVAAGHGVEDHVDKPGASNNSACFDVSSILYSYSVEILFGQDTYRHSRKM